MEKSKKRIKIFKAGYNIQKKNKKDKQLLVTVKN